MIITHLQTYFSIGTRKENGQDKYTSKRSSYWSPDFDRNLYNFVSQDWRYVWQADSQKAEKQAWKRKKRPNFSEYKMYVYVFVGHSHSFAFKYLNTGIKLRVYLIPL